MGMKTPDWELINKCNIWKVLGVTECNDCPDCKKCWGDDSKLPEPSNDDALEKLKNWVVE